MKNSISLYDSPVKQHLVSSLSHNEHMIFLSLERTDESSNELYIYPYAHNQPFLVRVKTAWNHLFGKKLSDNGLVIGWREVVRLKTFLTEIDEYWTKLKDL